MILEFDNNPNLTPEERILSLKESVQRALEESAGNSERLYKSLLKALRVESSSLQNNLTSISERLEQEAQALSEAITGAIERLETAEGSIEGITDDIGAMRTRISDAESAITTLQENYVLLEARVAALEGNEESANRIEGEVTER